MARVMSVILENDWENLVDTCSLDNWRQIMAGILANGGAESSRVIPLGNSLASRLEEEEALLTCACLIYVCAGNQEKVGSYALQRDTRYYAILLSTRQMIYINRCHS